MLTEKANLTDVRFLLVADTKPSLTGWSERYTFLSPRVGPVNMGCPVLDLELYTYIV